MSVSPIQTPDTIMYVSKRERTYQREKERVKERETCIITTTEFPITRVNNRTELDDGLPVYMVQSA